MKNAYKYAVHKPRIYTHFLGGELRYFRVGSNQFYILNHICPGLNRANYLIPGHKTLKI